MSNSTSLLDALANTLTSAEAQVESLNADLKANYNVDWANWLVSYTNGRVAASTAPVPPNAYEIGYVTDSTTGPGTTVPNFVYWPYPKLGDQPLCGQPAIPPMAAEPVPGTVAVGSATNVTGFYTIGPGDATAVGTLVQATSANGVLGVYQRLGGPAGMPGTGYYQLVERLS